MLTERDIVSSLDVEKEILRLKNELNAVILAHYYQDEDIQDIADFVGDSLDLSRKAAATDADVIVFCGVKFMAETAKILNPNKLVLLPDLKAGCSLEESCPADSFKVFREQHPNHIALTYVNCSAEVKALSDIIVTSTNAEHIIRQIPEDRPILFSPDKHLGRYLQRKTGREMLFWDGVCIVHDRYSERELIALKVKHPKAHVIAHPECPEALLRHAEHVGSTSSLLQFSADRPGQEFIVLTEMHMIHQMRAVSPGSTFYDVPGLDDSCACNRCPFMEMNTMDKLYLCMANQSPVVEIATDVQEGARKSLTRMLEMSEGVGGVKIAPSLGDAA